MGATEPRSGPGGALDLLVALERLAAIVDESRTEPEMLQRSLGVLRSVLGEQVSIELREEGTFVTDGPELRAPLVGGGRDHGALRASHLEVDHALAEGFVAASARVLGLGLARHRVDRVAPAGATSARSLIELVHRMRGVSATVGVAASAIRARGDDLAAGDRERLLTDIEDGVAALRRATDELTAATDTDQWVHDG